MPYAMNAPEPLLPDVQSSIDARDIAISRVGIKGLRYPLLIAGADGPVPSVASIDMYVALPGERKGTHMSRFIELLQESRDPVSLASLEGLLQRMMQLLDADEGSVELRFPYFINKAAPVSGVRSLMDYEVTLDGTLAGGRVRVRQTVVVPVTSLCPCSKKVSSYGAHNQRSHVTIQIETDQPFPIEAQVRIAEEAASSELWAVLKRPDEKHVTERAYDNPKFVEDTVRDVAATLERDPRVLAYRVETENFESIHNHSAYARIERDKRGDTSGDAAGARGAARPGVPARPQGR
jgi:GTP cyclohydrolase I